jgi:hypothetical protein
MKTVTEMKGTTAVGSEPMIALKGDLKLGFLFVIRGVLRNNNNNKMTDLIRGHIHMNRVDL